MKPWNPFHIQEFTPSQLEALLRPAFAEVKLRGQFASTEHLPNLDSSVAKHSAGTRTNAFYFPDLRRFREGIKAIVPNPMVNS